MTSSGPRDREQVGVADRLLPPPDRAGDVHTRDAGEAAHGHSQRLDHRLDRREKPAPAARVDEGQRLQDLLLAALPEVGQGAHLAGRRGCLQVLERSHAEPLVQRLHGLRTDALERGERGEVDRDALPVLLVQATAAGRDELLELLGHRLADAGDRAEPIHAALAVHLVEGAVVRLDRLRRLLVSPRLERDVLHVEVGREVTEASRELRVPHRRRR